MRDSLTNMVGEVAATRFCDALVDCFKGGEHVASTK
jgi:hypothetical protein